MERVLRKPDGVAEVIGHVLGGPVVELARRNPALLDELRANLLAAIARARPCPQPKPTEHWAIADGCAGIERAQLVIVNIRNASEREEGERLLEELDRIRKDQAVFDDVLGWRGIKVPISTVVANLADRNDPATRKAVARVHRAVRRCSR
jgi:hypothetical protein